MGVGWLVVCVSYMDVDVGEDSVEQGVAGWLAEFPGVAQGVEEKAVGWLADWEEQAAVYVADCEEEAVDFAGLDVEVAEQAVGCHRCAYLAHGDGSRHVQCLATAND